MDDIEVRELEECSIWSFEAAVRSGEAYIKVKAPHVVEQIVKVYLDKKEWEALNKFAYNREYSEDNVTMCNG